MTCTPVADSWQCMAKPLQYCNVIHIQLKRINLFKKLKNSNNNNEKKAVTNLDIVLKSRHITLLTKVHLAKAMVLLVVMYGCEN